LPTRRDVTLADSPARRRLTRNGLRPPAPQEIRDETGSGPSRALKVVATVAANLTLFTALLYYFGYLYTQVFFAYFRVHYTLLGQSVEEILARGVDGLLLPIAGAAGSGLVLLGAVRVLRSMLSERIWSAVLRVLTPVCAVIGLALIGVAVPIAIDPAPFREYAGLPGLGLALGVILLVFSWRRLDSRRHGSTFRVAEWITTYLLVALSLFWAVGEYSSRVGVRRAFEHELQLRARPAATLYSTQSLNLTAAGVEQVVCGQPDAKYKYRYTGLKLLLQSGGQYVFVPADWRASRGASFVIPRTDTLRLEFAPARTIPGKTC
jgi:hypothetical protein